MPTQDGHLVSQSNKLELQRSAAAHPEREQGTDSGTKTVAVSVLLGDRTFHVVRPAARRPIQI